MSLGKQKILFQCWSLQIEELQHKIGVPFGITFTLENQNIEPRESHTMAKPKQTEVNNSQNPLHVGSGK